MMLLETSFNQRVLKYCSTAAVIVKNLNAYRIVCLRRVTKRGQAVVIRDVRISTCGNEAGHR